MISAPKRATKNQGMSFKKDFILAGTGSVIPET
jgi:hypothetical protein